MVKLGALALLLFQPVALAGSAVTEALSVGDCTGAIRAQGTQSAQGATALALARCHLSQGDSTAALQHLNNVSDAQLQPYAQALMGQAKLAAGSPSAATPHLRAALAADILKDPVRSQARFALAMAQVQTGNLDGARTGLNALLTQHLAAPGRLPSPGGLDPAEVRWHLADTAVRRDVPARAILVWQAIWTRNPTSARSSDAAQRLRAAGAACNSWGSNPLSCV